MSKSKYLVFILPSLLIITFLFGKYEGGFISWFLFYTVLFLIIYLLIIKKFSLKEINIVRNFNRMSFTAGEEIMVEIEIWNRLGFPHSYMIIEDDIPDKFSENKYENKNLIYPWIRPKSSISYTIPNTIRGVHKWKKIELSTGDVFGLLRIKKTIDLNSEVIVYPHSHQIINWHSRNNSKIGNTFSQNRISEDTSSVTSVREYRYGDRFNRIHWKQSAKSRQLMTKEFERILTNNFMFFLNQNQKAYSNIDHFEKVVELTASLIRHSINQKFPTGLVSEGRSKKVVTLSRAQDHLLRIFKILATAEAISEMSFKNTVLAEIPFLQSGTTIVLLTGKMDEETYELLGELSLRRIKTEVFIIKYSDDLLDNEQSNFNNLNLAVHLIPLSKWDLFIKQGEIVID